MSGSETRRGCWAHRAPRPAVLEGPLHRDTRWRSDPASHSTGVTHSHFRRTDEEAEAGKHTQSPSSSWVSRGRREGAGLAAPSLTHRATCFCPRHWERKGTRGCMAGGSGPARGQVSVGVREELRPGMGRENLLHSSSSYDENTPLEKAELNQKVHIKTNRRTKKISSIYGNNRLLYGWSLSTCRSRRTRGLKPASPESLIPDGPGPRRTRGAGATASNTRRGQPSLHMTRTTGTTVRATAASPAASVPLDRRRPHGALGQRLRKWECRACR